MRGEFLKYALVYKRDQVLGDGYKRITSKLNVGRVHLANLL